MIRKLLKLSETVAVTPAQISAMQARLNDARESAGLGAAKSSAVDVVGIGPAIDNRVEILVQYKGGPRKADGVQVVYAYDVSEADAEHFATSESIGRAVGVLRKNCRECTALELIAV